MIHNIELKTKLEVEVVGVCFHEYQVIQVPKSPQYETTREVQDSQQAH